MVNDMRKNDTKTPAKPKSHEAANDVFVNGAFFQSFQMLLENRELVFQILNLLPIPIEIFMPDGTSVFLNQAYLDLFNIRDAGLITGKYNLLGDPVYNDQMGLREHIRNAFRGRNVTVRDVAPPVQDLIDRGVIREKPFEKAFADFHFYPVMDKGKPAFVVFICIVKKLYQGRPDLARAREYIDNHWQDEYDPHTVAGAVNMSVTQLYKIFKDHTGMTPGDYHKKAKVEHIKEKLADRNLSIKEAFAACGEDSQGRIARVFKEIAGMSPKQYRESLP